MPGLGQRHIVVASVKHCLRWPSQTVKKYHHLPNLYDWASSGHLISRCKYTKNVGNMQIFWLHGK